MEKKKSKKKIVLILLACLVLLAIVGWGAFSISIYNENFDQRFETYEPYKFLVEDFSGLTRTKYEFPSDQGQMLTGYLYSAGNEQHGIVVVAHGFGAGHNSYMDAINYFAQHGYYVFAYDATGNDESGGDSLGGIPQGPIDLEHAISFVEDSGYFPDFPICLFGHSWGGYSVCSVLTYHPEVKAVIECSGCNRSSDLFEAGGKEQARQVERGIVERAADALAPRPLEDAQVVDVESLDGHHVVILRVILQDAEGVAQGLVLIVRGDEHGREGIGEDGEDLLVRVLAAEAEEVGAALPVDAVDLGEEGFDRFEVAGGGGANGHKIILRFQSVHRNTCRRPAASTVRTPRG